MIAIYSHSVHVNVVVEFLAFGNVSNILCQNTLALIMILHINAVKF